MIVGCLISKKLANFGTNGLVAETRLWKPCLFTLRCGQFAQSTYLWLHHACLTAFLKVNFARLSSFVWAMRGGLAHQTSKKIVSMPVLIPVAVSDHASVSLHSDLSLLDLAVFQACFSQSKNKRDLEGYTEPSFHLGFYVSSAFETFGTTDRNAVSHHLYTSYTLFWR